MKKELSLTILTLLALVAVLIGGYYVFVSLPRSQDLKSMEMEFSRRREEALISCSDNAQKVIDQEWNTRCADVGLEPQCRLHPDDGENLDRRLETMLNHCYELYPQ